MSSLYEPTNRYANKYYRGATDTVRPPPSIRIIGVNSKIHEETIPLARKKKVGSTGRFGARYGAKLRRRVLDIENRRKESARCPACATRALKRKAVGLWTCRKCGLVFAGGAYVPFTDAGKAAKRAIAQRVSDDLLALRDESESESSPSFLPNLQEDERTIEAEDYTPASDENSEDEY